MKEIKRKELQTPRTDQPVVFNCDQRPGTFGPFIGQTETFCQKFFCCFHRPRKKGKAALGDAHKTPLMEANES